MILAKYAGGAIKVKNACQGIDEMPATSLYFTYQNCVEKKKKTLNKNKNN
jgi:hypothetical protein